MKLHVPWRPLLYSVAFTRTGSATSLDGTRDHQLLFASAATIVLLVAAAFRLWGLPDLPPGLHQDEAIYGVNALSVLEGTPRIFYGEREPLYMYIAAIAFLIAGPTTFALRLASAAVGMIVVAAGGALANRLFGRSVGLLAALGLATSLWLVPLSRLGFRAITLPAIEGLALALLWNATCTRRPRDYILAGAFLGLSLYTYLAARFLPIALVAFILLIAIFHLKWLRLRMHGLLATAMAATVAVVPLGLYFLRHPEALYGRAEQVVLSSDQPLVEIARNTLRTAGMVAWRGDTNWRHNLSGAPAFDPLWTIFLAIGVAVALWRRTPAHLFALAVAGVMLVPSALSIDSPHYLRTLGAAPALYALAALGVGIVAHSLRERWGVAAASAAVALAVVATFARGINGYFVTYAASPEVPRAFNTDLAAAGRYLATSSTWQTNRERVAITDRFLQDRASVAFFLYPLLSPSERARWLEPRVLGTFYNENTAIPLYDGPALYLAGGDGARLAETLGSALASNEARPLGGGLHLRIIQTNGPASPEPERPVTAQFSDWLSLEGASAHDSSVMLLWRLHAQPPGPRSIFVHLRDQDDHVLEGTDTLLPGTDGSEPWPRRFATWHRLTPPAGTPPGSYQLEVGIYDPASGRPEQVQLADRTDARVPLGPVTLDRAPTGEIAPSKPLSVEVRPGLTLVGIDVPGTTMPSGIAVPVALYWRADATPLPDLTMRIGLLGVGGVEQGFHVGRPAPGYPTSRWRTGDIFTQLVDVRTRPEANGELRIIVQVGTADDMAQPVDVGTILVQAPERSFTPTEPEHRVDALFQGVGQLSGYEIAPSAPRGGDVLVVTLHWIASGDYTSDETVFVHLTDETGQIRAQQDSPPAGGRRPTSTWTAGEVVDDRHEIALPLDLPEASYVLKVGLYDRITGRRVAVASGQGGDHVEIGKIEVSAANREVVPNRHAAPAEVKIGERARDMMPIGTGWLAESGR